MKIIDRDHPLAPKLIGTICDHCGFRVEQTQAVRADPAKAIAVAGKLAEFISVDLREHEHIQRLDLCPRCAGKCLSRIRPFLCSVRQITERGNRGDRWPAYKFRYMDPDGHIVTCQSAFDELMQ